MEQLSKVIQELQRCRKASADAVIPDFFHQGDLFRICLRGTTNMLEIWCHVTDATSPEDVDSTDEAPMSAPGPLIISSADQRWAACRISARTLDSSNFPATFLHCREMLRMRVKLAEARQIITWMAQHGVCPALDTQNFCGSSGASP